MSTKRHPVVSFVLLCALAAACSTESAPPPGSAWDRDALPKVPEPPSGVHPQYRLEPRHLGLAPAGTSVGAGLTLAWRSEALAIGTYSASKSSPAVDEGLVYIGVDDGRLYALRRVDGTVQWTYETHRYDKEMSYEGDDHRGIHGTPAFDDEQVYIGDYSGWMYAIRKHDGTLKWETKLAGSIGASPTLYAGRIFIAVEYPTPDGKIFVVDAESGQWESQTPFLGDHAHSTVSLDPERGYMLVGANNGYLFCYDFVSTELAWSLQTGGEVKSTAAVAADVAYVTSWSKKLHAVEIATGKQLFEVETGSIVMSSPSVYEGSVCFGSHDGHVRCVGAEDGQPRWSFDTGGSITSSPTIVPDTRTLLIGSHARRIRALGFDDGQERWSYDVGSGITSVPVATGNQLFVNDNSGTVWCFEG